MSLRERIAQARNEATPPFTQQSLAEALNVGQSTVSTWEREEKPNEPGLETLKKIAHLTGVDVAWLAFGQAQTAALLNGERYASIVTLDIDAAAGPGVIARTHPAETHTMFESNWLRQLTPTAPDRLAVIRVRGDSMEHTLRNGDHILVDLNRRKPSRPGVYVIRVDDELQVKRITMHPKTRILTVASDNPLHPTYEMKSKDVNIEGQVIWIGRALV